MDVRRIAAAALPVAAGIAAGAFVYLKFAGKKVKV